MATYSGIIGEGGPPGAMERFRTLSQRAKDAEARLGTLESDSGWHAASPLLNGWANSGVAGDVVTRYRKLGGVVTVEASVSGGTLNLAAFQLPAAYRPSAAIYTAGVDSGGSGVSGWKIDASGNVVPLSGAANLRITVSFPADQ